MSFLKKRPYIAFILPGLIVYATFVILPLFNSIYYSFFDWNGIGPMTFIGLENYQALLFDARLSRIFFNAVGNNLRYVLAALTVIMPTQILLAYFLFLRIRGYRVFQMLIFMPFVLSSAIVAFFSMITFDPNIGILNTVLDAIGLERFAGSWYGDPRKSFFLLVGTAMWQGMGVGMMIFLANLKSVSDDLFEAAVIDGANGFRQFFSIALPSMMPSLTNVIVLSTIFGLTIFELPYIIGGAQGGVNNSLDFINVMFYRNTFSGMHGGDTAMGFGASITTVLFFIVFAVALIQLTILNRIRLEE